MCISTDTLRATYPAGATPPAVPVGLFFVTLKNPRLRHRSRRARPAWGQGTPALDDLEKRFLNDFQADVHGIAQSNSENTLIESPENLSRIAEDDSACVALRISDSLQDGPFPRKSFEYRWSPRFVARVNLFDSLRDGRINSAVHKWSDEFSLVTR